MYVCENAASHPSSEEAAYRVLYENRDPREEINRLMLRQKTCEVEGAEWAR